MEENKKLILERLCDNKPGRTQTTNLREVGCVIINLEKNKKLILDRLCDN